MLHVRRQVIVPAPRYDDAWAAIAFLERSFGFARHQVHEGPNGEVAHGELRLGAASVGLSSASGPVRPENPWTSVRSGVYVALPDAGSVDAHHARAVAAGATIAMPLENTDYGSRQYSVWDRERHLWCFGTYTQAPADDSRLFVVLRYADWAVTCEWLEQAFGFERAGTGHAAVAEPLELRLGDGRLWLSRAAQGDVCWGDSWHATHVIVPDVEAHYARAKQSGATIVASLAPLDGFGRGYVARDTEGFLWTFGSEVPATAPLTDAGGRRS